MRHLTVALLAWYFVNTWPNSHTSTLIEPFRTLSQCSLFRQVQQKLGARVSQCQNNSETPPSAWRMIINGGQTLSLTAGPFQDQTECEAFRAAVIGTNEDTASACWPN